MKGKAMKRAVAEQHIPPHSINPLNQYISEQPDNTEEQREAESFLSSSQVVVLMSHVGRSTVNTVMGTPSLFKRSLQDKQTRQENQLKKVEIVHLQPLK